MQSMAFRQQLRDGLHEMGIAHSTQQEDQLLAYISLLQKWNTAFNLSGVRDVQDMLSRHLLDSLSLHTRLSGQRVLDVGTGPGLPGIPLAIWNPDKTFDLLDSNGKKTRFVFQAVLELGLNNVRVHHKRIETFTPEANIDVIVSRAFSTLQDLVSLTHHLQVNGHTKIIAMKGQYPQSELEQLPPEVDVIAIEKVVIPGNSGERHLIELRRNAVG